MIDKKTEALKLALNKAFQLGQRYWSWADSEYSSHWKKADAAKAEFDQFVQDTINAALAEQPAQQKPLIGETNVELGFYSNDASNGQQRELVGKVEMGQLVGNRSHESASNPDAKREIAVITGVDEYGPMLNWYTHWVNFPIGTKLYTSPPASKPLTMQERTSIVRANTSFHDKNGIDAYGIIDDVEAAHGITGDA